MKFRTKLFYAFSFLGLISTLFALVTIYVETSRLISKEMESKIVSLLSCAQKKIHPTFLEKVIQDQGKTDSIEFKTIHEQLLDILDFNRRSDIYIESIYLMKKQKDSNLYDYVMAVGFDELNKEHPFEKIDPFLDNGLFHPLPVSPYLKKKEANLRAYAPIVNKEGRQIAFLGVNVRKREVCLEQKKLFLYGCTAFGVSILVAIGFASFLSKHVSKSLKTFCALVRKVGKGEFNVEGIFDARDEFKELFTSIQAMARGLEERERLKSNFARYVSKHALEEVLKKEGSLSLASEGKRQRVTLLFSDIQQFTTLSEELPPEEVLKILNQYFTEMISVIFQYQGTLDKFIGDGMMVEFGAPFEDSKQELHAILAAIHMQRRLKEISDQWEKEGKQPLSMGIGIHAGFAVLGNIGSELRMEYTAIGDTVNVASRLERLTRKIGRSIIVSKSVYDKVKGYFIFEDLKEIEIRGRKGTLQIYSIDPYDKKNLEAFDLIHNREYS